MEIKVNEYENGEVKSLGYSRKDGRNATIGVVLPGRPHTFKADHKETILVIDGELTINDRIMNEGEAEIVEAGGHVNIEAVDAPAAYRCIYN